MRSAAKATDTCKITYRSEWLGYLPFGLYHWVEIDGQDVSDGVRDMDTLDSDLEQLTELGLLERVKPTRNQVTNISSDPEDVCREYSFTRHAIKTWT